MLSFIGNREYALNKLVARQASRQITTESLSQNSAGMGFGSRPLQQFAQAQVVYTQPSFYSPLHTPQNWQIPTKRREIYQWLRYWYDNEPKVAAAIDFYSQFPVNGFETQCENSTVKMFFDHLNKRLNLDKWVKHISKEFYLLGDCFPFLEINCDSCHGSGVDRHGKPCDHKGADFSRLVVMNPDSIDVQASVLADEPVVTLMPDEQLRNIVWTKQPAKIYNRLPPHIRSLILAGKPIPLANESISHLKYNPHPYEVYGKSIVRRLFKMLTYKDKLMTAQWIIAERLILPIRIIKVGDAERPAGPVDIADVQAQIAQVSSDPNLTLVTHHAIDYDWIGASGKILQLSNEYELINKEMLQGLMLNDALLDGTMAGYQCHDMQTKALTRNGFKFYEEITMEDEIACFNKETGFLEYYKPTKMYSKDFDGELVHFQTTRMDIAVTENHRILHQPRESNAWIVSAASDIGTRSRFRKTVLWNDGQSFDTVELGKTKISLNDYLEIAALYITEGYARRETRRNRSTYGDPMSIVIYQTSKGKAWNTVNNLKDRCPLTIAHYPSSHGDQFCIHDKKAAIELSSEYGCGSAEKRIPKWVKNLPRKVLRKFLQDMIDGDGHRRHDNRGNGEHCRYTYYTKSSRLKDDVMEIALKCGYYPQSKFIESRGIWTVAFSDKDFESDFLLLKSKRHDAITRMPYKGKVWCLTVPTGFFVSERNGKIAIQGNSAAIGAESMIQRMESWRSELARWIEEKIYKQVAIWKGFVDEEATEELKKIGIDEPVYIYPKIKWDDLNLRDDTQQKNLWMQLHERQAMSTRTLLEKFGLDYDMEVERMRFESAMQSFGGGGMGGTGGGGMGGGMGGGAPPPMGGGGAPGGEMGGLGGMGGEAGAPPGGVDLGAGMGGMGAAPGGPPAGGATAGMGGSMGKILSKGRKPPQQPEEAEVQPMIRLTSLEQKMYQILLGMRLPFIQKAQSQIGPYIVDFSIPALRIAIECDGDQWHSTQEARAHDQKRDMDLAKVGWTTIRFSERELQEKDQAVKNTILELVYKLWRKAAEESKDRTKKASRIGATSIVEMRLTTGWLVADLNCVMEDPGMKRLGLADRRSVVAMDREIRTSSPFNLEGETEVNGIVLPIVPDFGDGPGPEGAVDGTANQGQGNTLAGDVRGEELVP